LIRDAGQEIQLHLHPEWTDEIEPPPLPEPTGKRQHLRNYSLEEQIVLLGLGARLLEDAGAPKPTAFRAGNFGANRDTFTALGANGIRYDSSVNATKPDSVPDLRDEIDVFRISEIGGVCSCPMSVFRDGVGNLRHAQVGACSNRELERAIDHAYKLGWRHFVALSHSFEMLKVGSSNPDWIVVNRFRRLCEFLGHRSETLLTTGFDGLCAVTTEENLPLPSVGPLPTLQRYAEQALRRIL
jgi:hypothetical protein